jgi:hypothetical protein
LSCLGLGHGERDGCRNLIFILVVIVSVVIVLSDDERARLLLFWWYRYGLLGRLLWLCLDKALKDSIESFESSWVKHLWLLCILHWNSLWGARNKWLVLRSLRNRWYLVRGHLIWRSSHGHS